jgi:uncharacterized protein DUF4397
MGYPMRRSVGTVFAALTLSLSAACGTGGTLGPSEVSALRFENASPDSPPVDIFLRGGQVVQGLPYASGHPYIFVNPGSGQLIEVRDNVTDDVLLDYTASLAAGSAYTFAFTGLAGSRQGLLFTDDTSAASAGNFKVRVLHLAPLGPAMDLYITDANADLTAEQPLATGITYPNPSAYVTAPIGHKQLRLTESGTKTVLRDVGTFDFTSGQSVTLFLIGAPGSGGGGAPYSSNLVADHS